MQYPLSEKIGDPDLFVGREKEFRLLNKWLSNIPKRLSKSRVILARRKNGKTALERDEELVRTPLSLEEVKEYGLANTIKLLVRDIEFFLQNQGVGGSHDLMCSTNLLFAP
jgi:hypothetical protein